MQRNVFVKRMIFAVAAVAAVALIVLVAVFLRNRLFSSAQITQTDNLALSSDMELYPFAGGGFISVKGSELLFLDGEGKLVSSKEIPTGDDIIISPAGKSVAVYHDEQMKIYFPASDAADSEKPLNIAMSDMVCSTQNDYVALLDNERSTIYILNEKGTNIDRIHFSDQTVINMGWFYAQRELLWVVALDASGSAPVSVVRIYEPNKTEVALKQFTDELVYDLVINSESASALAVGTKHISSVPLSSSSAMDVEVLVYGYQFMAASDSGSVIVMAPISEISRGYVTSLRIIKGKEAVNMQLPAGCSAFSVGEKNIYAADAATIYTIGFDGKVKETKNFDVLFNEVQAVGNRMMVFFSSSSATLINLPD
ncbi:MAG: DUF5711 family protein [Christensenellales bacterium]|jgi:hypothetical protein